MWLSDPSKETWVLPIILDLIWRATLRFLSSKLIIDNPSSWSPHFRFGVQKICRPKITLGLALPVGSLVEPIVTTLYCNFWFFMFPIYFTKYQLLVLKCISYQLRPDSIHPQGATHVSINRISFILKYLLDLRILLNISRLLMAALNGRLPSFVHLFIQCSGVFVFEDGQLNRHLVPRCIIDGHQPSLYQWLIIRYIKKLYVIVSAALINVIYIFVLCSCSR